MNNVLKFDFGRLDLLLQKRGSAVVGMTLDGGRLEVVWLKRTNGSVLPVKQFAAALSLDPLTNEPQLVGREIRNLLETQGVKERRCVFGLPLKWALTAHTQIPELPEADIPSFLQIESERGFPCDVATLIVGQSQYALPSGQRHATFVGIPRNHVELLERVLMAAQLRPLSMCLGLTQLQPPSAKSSNGLVSLAIGETHVALQVTYGGGLAALRALEGAIELEAGRRTLHADVVARETRITLAQLPAELRAAVKRIRIFGPADMAQQLADEIELRLEPMGLEVEVADGYGMEEFVVHVPREAPVSAAFSMAARALGGEPPTFEFLPPKVSRWQKYVDKYSSGRLQRVGLAAAAAAVLVGGAFGIQQYRLWRLETQWNSMKKQVTELKELQKRTSQFRPWHNETLRSMNILRRLTEAFPEDGSVTASVVEILDPGLVTCRGTARDYQALLKTVERLRAIRQIPDVNLGQTRGKSPALQFTFNFMWNEGGRSAK